ncbi:striatin-interacting protein 1 homolog [Penaeus vannamei]|uniref:striatin-interacting protein 1 homolog n=1 Tax=Penaeus vannamei TaxID=6689 RepID=UPI00387F3AD2
MDNNGDCKRSLPKLREIFTRQRQDSDAMSGESTSPWLGGEASMADCPDIEFNYDDADLQENEMAELYSYTEGPEFQLNLKAWEEVCAELGVVPLWQSATDASRRSLIVRLSDHLELCHRSPRMRAARAILYIAQGCWGEVQSDREQAMWARRNVFLLVQCGVWASFLQLLHLEIENVGTESQRKQAVSASLADSADLRVILSVLYTIVETLRVLGDDDNEVQTQIRLAFCEELAQPQAEAEELVAMTLLGMVTRFCNSSAPHFPIRKVLLLLWKVLLCSLGGTQVLAQLKNTYRENHGLPPCGEDTLTIARTMRASSPPASAADLIEQQNNQKRRPFRRGLMKQSSLDDSVGELDLTAAADEDEQPPTDMDEPPDLPQPPSPRPGTPINNNSTNKGLPWTPKVRQKDIDSFLDSTRVKFVGFQLQGDRTSLAGLPQPIHEGVKVLSKDSSPGLPGMCNRRPPEMTAEALEAGTGSPRGGSLSPGGSGGSPSGGEGNMQMVSGTCCWRNMFSCINLLRILNKLCKWKHSRIMMLVVFKSAPILKRTLKVKHAMMQLYVLKLLKMQTKYLGRQWRKTNMKTMSAIYQKVRHRLNDDWAYGNDPDARPWDFQAEECALRACVDRFNSRRYNNTVQDPDFEPLDNCVTSVLGRPVELTEEFKRHYEVWLQQEVFSASIDWDQLLASSN